MNTKFLQMMSLSALVLIGLAGSGNCDLNECAEACWNNTTPDHSNCGLRFNDAQKYYKCGREFVTCYDKCEKEGVKAK